MPSETFRCGIFNFIHRQNEYFSWEHFWVKNSRGEFDIGLLNDV